ncbi:MAG: HEAT repeat domain-containing protein [Planctomycetota bacterium]
MRISLALTLFLFLAPLLFAGPSVASAPSAKATNPAPDIAPLVAQLEQDLPDADKMKVVVQLSRMDDSVIPSLLAAWPVASPVARPFLLRALVCHPTDETKALLLAELKANPAAASDELLSAIGRLRIRDAGPVLIALYAQEQDPEKRQSLLATLANVRDPRAVDLLGQASLSEERVESIMGISGLQQLASLVEAKELSKEDAEAVRARLQALVTASGLPAETLGGLITACGLTGDAALADAIITHVDDNSVDLRSRTLEAIGRMRARRHAPDVVHALDASEKSIRVKAAEALERIGDKTTIPDLIPLLRDPEPLVRSRVLRALRKISGRNLPPNPEHWQRWYETSGHADED